MGGGEILRYLEKTGIKGTGIESDIAEYNYAKKKGLNVINCYIEIKNDDPQINQLIYDSDVISFMNVIEHVENPVAFTSYFTKRMKSGSLFVFEVPRHPSMASFANQTCDHAVYRHIDPPVHLQIFSEESLKYLLGDGLTIIGKWEFGQGYTDLLTNAMLLSGQQESALYVDLMSLSNKIQPIIDEAGFADQMLIVAQKK